MIYITKIKLIKNTPSFDYPEFNEDGYLCIASITGITYWGEREYKFLLEAITSKAGAFLNLNNCNNFLYDTLFKN